MPVKKTPKQEPEDLITEEPSDIEDVDEDEDSEEDEWLTIEESAERLGISTRYFRQLIARDPIEGTKKRGRAILYPGSAIDGMVLDDKDEQQTALSALMRETARAAKEIHLSAALAIKAGVEALQGTDPRTLSLLEELKRVQDRCGMLEQEKSEVWVTFKEMQETHAAEMRAAAVRERERILEGVRNDAVSEGFRQLMPGIIHKMMPTRQTEQTILTHILEALPDPVREEILTKLLANLPPALQASLGALIQDGLEAEAKRQAEKKKAAEGEPSAA